MIHQKLFLPVIALCLLLFSSSHGTDSLRVVVFTDYEADDSIALALLLKDCEEHSKNISKDTLLIGTLLSNQYRKKALAQDLLRRFGVDPDIVIAGTGGIKEPFEEEGKNILSPEELKKFAEITICPDSELTDHFLHMLAKAESNSIDVLLLTNPIDFVAALTANPKHMSKIKKIYMMGGWFGNKPSFNWNLHIESVIQLFKLMEKAKEYTPMPHLIIFSSHFFAREFNGYTNQDKFPAIIQAFDKSTHPVIDHLRNMVKNWDDSMTVIKDHHTESEKKWRLEMVDRIGKENIGRQFTPADPATMLGYLYSNTFIEKQTPVKITITNHIDSQNKMAPMVEVQPEPSSNIFVVEKVNLAFFNDALVALMNMSPVPQYNA